MAGVGACVGKQEGSDSLGLFLVCTHKDHHNHSVLAA